MYVKCKLSKITVEEICNNNFCVLNSYFGIRGSIHDHTLSCAKSSSVLFLHDVGRTCFNFVQRKGFSREMISHLLIVYACIPRRVYRFFRKVPVFYRYSQLTNCYLSLPVIWTASYMQENQ